MVNKYVNIFKYPGNKKAFLDIILPIINSSKYSTYIEPFLGSGVIYLNTNFKKYIINDTFTVYTDILKVLGTIDFNTINEYYTDITNKFGNIGKNKESYYAFRDYVNSLDISNEKHLGIYYLSRSCINSMVRFGPNGFNQGFGNRCRGLFLTQEHLNVIKHKLSNTTIYNTDYKDLLKYDSVDTIWVLDPPYIEAPIDTYSNNFNHNEFKDFVTKLKGSILYFDTENAFGDTFFKHKIILRTMNSIAPKSKETRKTECLYHNIDTNVLF